MSSARPPTSLSRWGGSASAYAASFARLCAGAVEALLDETRVGHLRDLRLLDVGTGPGTLAADAITRGARVIAADPDAAMLAFAAGQVPGATLVRAAAPGLPFRSGSFDVVTANFVLNHVGDPRRALADLVRVTTLGGEVALTIWPSGLSAMNQLWGDVLAASGADAPPNTPLPQELDFPRSVAGLGDLLIGAGLVPERVVRHDWTFRIPPEVLWLGPAGGVATIGAAYLSQSDETRRRMKREYDRLVRPLTRDGMLELPMTAILAVGEKHH
ncbi:Methyltransferase domain-containing protein [Frankineae bacterium MT45]|nr:Methyltransferase domain-containing protein [Frankineae bacterium MT45]